MYALESIGWIVSPFLAGIILERFGFSWVFIGVALFPLLAIPLIIKTRTKDVPHTTLHRSVFSLKSNFFDFLSEKRLHLPYIFSASIGFWWNFLYIYPPLFLVNSGYSEFWVGIFIGAINIPTLFFEYLAGKQITYHHFRTFFLIGYCLLAFFAILCFLISSLPIILILLVLASIPLSYVEPIQPAYFFSLVKRKDEERYYPVFDTSFDMGSMIGKFLPALILLFLPASFTFLAVGLCMLALAGLSLKVHR
jgi:predicted MFS family arabinose efflux permease